MANPLEFDFEALAVLMDERGIANDSALAAELGVTKGYISQIRAGVRAPSGFLISRFYTELDVPFEPDKEGSIYRLTEEEINYQNNKEDLL